MRWIGFVWLALGACACATPAQPVERGAPLEPHPVAVPATVSERPIDVDVEDADLRDVVAEIGRRVGRNLVVEPDVNERVTINLRKVAWRDALTVIAKMTKCEVEPRGSLLVLAQPPLVTIQDGGDCNVRTFLTLLAAYGGKSVVFAGDVRGDGPAFEIRDLRIADVFARTLAQNQLHATRRGHVIVVSTRPLEFGTPDLFGRTEPTLPSGQRFTARTVDLALEAAPLGAVAAELSRELGYPFRVEGDPDLTLTFTVHAAPWRDVLAYVLHVGALDLREDPDAIVLVARPKNTIQATDANASTFLRLMADYAGKSIILTGGRDERVTLDLKDISYEDALRVTAEVCGYTVLPGAR